MLLCACFFYVFYEVFFVSKSECAVQRPPTRRDRWATTHLLMRVREGALAPKRGQELHGMCVEGARRSTTGRVTRALGVLQRPRPWRSVPSCSDHHAPLVVRSGGNTRSNACTHHLARMRRRSGRYSDRLDGRTTRRRGARPSTSCGRVVVGASSDTRHAAAAELHYVDGDGQEA
jgi:hypothetical protein